MNAKDELPVVIIGSGISGLSCAKSLLGKIPCKILEKDMKPGGRIQSDIYNGYILDRGFQIFIDSYPYVQDNQIIDKESLELKPFLPGALIYTGNSFCRISDPLRKPDELFNTLFSPVGTFSDKLKVGIYSIFSRLQSLEEIESSDDITTRNFLSTIGISDSIVDKFFKPFYQGIFLSALEEQSSRMFQFVFKMLSSGSGCLPNTGMGKLPLTVAASLPSNSFEYNTTVTRISRNTRSDFPKYTVDAIQDGKDIRLDTNYVVLATDAPSARSLLLELQSSTPNLQIDFSSLISIQNRSSTCVYYGIHGPPPILDPILILNGENDLSKDQCVIRVNNVCFPSQLSTEYAPKGNSLASVTLIGSLDNIDDITLDKLVKTELEKWWGKSILEKWKFLRIYRIKYAQPAQKPPYSYGKNTCKLADGLYMCGDHVGSATLNGAIESGVRVAKDIVEKISN